MNMPRLYWRDGSLALSPTCVMGIVNVTPDSFFGGSRAASVEAAVARAAALAAEGAHVIDIGAESTRPGHAPVSAEEEQARLLPVLEGIRAQLALPISVDTYKASTAAAALARGAVIVNDIQGLQGDPDMARVAADHGAAVIAMHNRATVDADIDILADMVAFFERTLAIAARAGIGEASLVLDPGIGFGKTPRQNLVVIAHLAELRARFHQPILVGASRKSFINAVVPSTPEERLPGTLATHLAAVAAGCEIIRVHDVAAHVQAFAVAAAIGNARS
ncbi:dihydropteroate synthase [Chelatococcus sp. SYSU_G07232]|uniref:dihydropteroate synthase n=1 Tax=Chelatococcus albus TaxID=3047466 RepID=A0ABT7AJ73_9HYPH|nr:dihydropteroate synthase [Chelatococcus sp. SYSU_G07232]MDJ1159419.1 dihydropteroate synthase [Chelatococcus sp. SYSU_G07232]